MKKILIVTLNIVIICSLITNIHAYEKTDNLLYNLVEHNYEYCGKIKKYKPFKYKNLNINLYTETTLTKVEAQKKYKKAYEYFINQANKLGITPDLDNYGLQQYIKSYFLSEDESIKEFVNFMDIYENKNINQVILNLLSQEENNFYIEDLMPVSNYSTQLSNDNDEESSLYESNGYDADKAIDYAERWWNKTNNADYPYYAIYYKLDSSSNDYNDLDDNFSNQTPIRRNWSDCTNFVSQCIKEGGMSYRKTGIILPYRQTKNWYYDDTKPSHTWGGAHNFYLHWKERAGVTEYSSSLTKGDVVSIDFTGDGDIDHIAIISSDENNTNETKLLTQHSVDRNKYLSDGSKYSLEYLYKQNYTIFGFEMDKAPLN